MRPCSSRKLRTRTPRRAARSRSPAPGRSPAYTSSASVPESSAWARASRRSRSSSVGVPGCTARRSSRTTPSSSQAAAIWGRSSGSTGRTSRRRTSGRRARRTSLTRSASWAPGSLTVRLSECADPCAGISSSPVSSVKRGAERHSTGWTTGSAVEPSSWGVHRSTPCPSIRRRLNRPGPAAPRRGRAPVAEGSSAWTGVAFWSLPSPAGPCRRRWRRGARSRWKTSVSRSGPVTSPVAPPGPGPLPPWEGGRSGCRTSPTRSQPSSSYWRSASANHAACARPTIPYRSSKRCVRAIEELKPATTVRSSGTGKSVHGWSEPKTVSSPWYSSSNSRPKCRHFCQ